MVHIPWRGPSILYDHLFFRFLGGDPLEYKKVRFVYDFFICVIHLIL